ncbi:MAG: zinc-binding dehydrogenase [Actinocatenispora sp.]
MKAMVPTNTGGAGVALAEVDEPRPVPDEIVVAVDAYSVNRGETLLLERPAPGWRPGKDVAGVVTRAAASGTGPAVGDRVVAHPPYGGWAERVAVPVTSVARLPDTVGNETAAALPLAGLTALRLVRAAGPLPGRRLLVTGASGGVGHYTVELAVAAGAEVTALSATPGRGGRLAELGAEVVHEVSDADGPFDVVLESVGGATLAATLGRLVPGGLLVWFGQASREPATLDFFQFFDGPNEALIRHFDYTRSDRTYAEDLETLVRLVVEGRLHPEIGLVDDWTVTAEVLDLLRRRRVRGNAVLTLG